MLFRVLPFLFCLIVTPASACRYTKQADLSDVLNADAVIVGSVDKYEIVEVELRDLGPRPNHVRFVIRVEEIITGDVSSRLSLGNKLVVTSREFIFGLSEDFDSRRRLLFALRVPLSPSPSVESNVSAILFNHEPQEFVVLQQLCSRGLIFDASGPLETALQQVLETDRDQVAELEILEEFILEREAFSKMQSEIYRLKWENHRLRSN